MAAARSRVAPSSAPKRARRRRAPRPPPAPLPANPSTNAEVALAFEEMADLLEISGESQFRIRAYRTAAQRVREEERSCADRIRAGEDLDDIPSIGADLAAKIDDLVRTGTTPMLDEMRARVPPGLRELLKLPGLGPKRVKLLHDALAIDDIDGLRRALAAGTLGLKGFGPITEQRVREALPGLRAEPVRFRLDAATAFAEDIVRWLRGAPGVRRVVVAGSYRRARETVGDLDVLATGDDAHALVDRFVRYRDAATIVARGETRATIRLAAGRLAADRLAAGLQVDLRVVDDHSYGAALHYFTGSKAHNIAVRRLGQRRGLKINEYGVFRGDRRVAGDTEESVFASVGLPFIEPELRENRGEIEAAKRGDLPVLVTLRDLRGDLHAHTRRTDGMGTIEAMVEAARARGLSYLAITDHSRRIAMAHGLDEKALAEHAAAIARAAARLTDFDLLTGIEVDILEDGSLDLSDEALLGVDVVVASVHAAFDLPRARQTERLLRAMDHRPVGILGHLTGRLIGQRPAIDVDVERVVRHARDRGTVLELNSHPDRLDLADVHCRLAQELGVLVAISSDAHSPAGLGDLRFGVGQARRGWLKKADVLNTRSAREVRATLRRLRA